MNQVGKIALMQHVLDELATVGYLTCIADKKNSLKVVRELLRDFEPKANGRPDTETATQMKFRAKSHKADVSILSMKLIANAANLNNDLTGTAFDRNLNKNLTGLSLLAEKALTELLKP